MDAVKRKQQEGARATRPENRITSGGGVSYTYDGDGLRVKKSSGTLYWRALGGDAIAETDASGNVTSEYVFFARRRLARRDASGNTFYYFTDHLGTTRSITQSNGAVCYDADFTPYGQEMNHTNTCPQNYKFTGYERDPETGLDYAFARYYNPRLARFMSPDPLGGTSGDPQSLNGYAYVGNHVLNASDPSGLREHPVSMPNTYDPFYAGPGNCIMDGITVPCSIVNDTISVGLAAPCPDNDCGPRVGNDGHLYPIILTDEGFQYVNLHGGDPFSNGSEVGLLDLENLPGALPGISSGAPGDPGGGGDGVGALKDAVRKLFDNTKCAALFGDKKNALKQIDIARVYPPDTFNPSIPGSVYAGAILVNYPHGGAFSGGNIFLGPKFFDQSLGAQETIFIHELRHQAYNTGEPPITDWKAYSKHRDNDYSTIVNACGTQMPTKR